MKLDIILSTLGSPARLAKTLNAFCALDVSNALTLSIITINAASNQSSAAVLREFKTRLPMRILEPRRPGKNAALNHALAFSQGELVVFTDENTVPRNDWLRQLANASIQQPRFDLFGGTIAPKWPAKPPARLLREVPLASAFAITQDTLESGPCDASEFRGNNMAVRKYVFLAGHRFDESGTDESDGIISSENEFLLRCQKARHKAFFVRQAIVEHMISNEQLTAQWLKGRGHQFGRSYFFSKMNTLKDQPQAAELGGAPRWALRKMLSYQARAALSFATNYNAVWKAGFYAGYMREYQNWHRSVSRDTH